MADKKKAAGEVLVKNVRASFANVYKPGKDNKNDKGETVPGKFGCRGLMYDDDPDTKANMDKLWNAIDDALEAKYGDKIPKIKADRMCLRDGADEEYDGYENCWYISANNEDKPELITKQKDEEGHWIPAREGQIYSGCIVNMLVQIWVQDNEFGKRVNARLKAVQFVAKGEAFGNSGPVDTDKAFEEIEADEGNDMDDRGSRGGRGRDDDRGRGRGRDDDGGRGRDRDSGRGRERDSDRGDDRGRGRSRDDDDDRGSRGSRGDDRGSSGGRDRDDSRGRGRGSDDDDRGSSRGRGRDDDSRGSSRGRDRDDDDRRPSRDDDDRRSSRGRDAI